MPNNCCKGKCHLKKQLDEEEKKEQTPPARNVKEVKEFQLFFQQHSPVEFVNVLSIQQSYTPCQFSELTSPSFSIFHPPKC